MNELTNCHRLTLTREWIGTGGRVNWIMLNPSTADERSDDPTIRKCIGFSKRWGFSSLVVTNLFAFRATYPKDLKTLAAAGCAGYMRAIGEGNRQAIEDAASNSDMVVVAWGANAAYFHKRVDEVLEILPTRKLYCIGLTKGWYPLHPCMAGYTDAPLRFESQETT